MKEFIGKICVEDLQQLHFNIIWNWKIKITGFQICIYSNTFHFHFDRPTTILAFRNHHNLYVILENCVFSAIRPFVHLRKWQFLCSQFNPIIAAGAFVWTWNCRQSQLWGRGRGGGGQGWRGRVGKVWKYLLLNLLLIWKQLERCKNSSQSTFEKRYFWLFSYRPVNWLTVIIIRRGWKSKKMHIFQLTSVFSLV